MKRSSAFTLIELLVVIAIISLLVTILIPSLQKVKEYARDLVCLTNQKTIARGITLYANDYDDQIPYNRSWDKDEPRLNWYHKISRAPLSSWNTGGYEPEDLHILEDGYIDVNDTGSGSEGIFQCPTWHNNVSIAYPYPFTYSINGAISPDFKLDDEDRHDQGEKRLYARRTSSVARNVILTGDSAINPAGGRAYAQTCFRATRPSAADYPAQLPQVTESNLG